MGTVEFHGNLLLGLMIVRDKRCGITRTHKRLLNLRGLYHMTINLHKLCISPSHFQVLVTVMNDLDATSPLALSFPDILRNPGLAHLNQVKKRQLQQRDQNEGKRWLRRKDNGPLLIHNFLCVR